MLQYNLSPTPQQRRLSDHLLAVCRRCAEKLKLCGRGVCVLSAPECQSLVRCRLAGPLIPMSGGISLLESPGTSIAEALLVSAGSPALAGQSDICCPLEVVFPRRWRAVGVGCVAARPGTVAVAGSLPEGAGESGQGARLNWSGSIRLVQRSAPLQCQSECVQPAQRWNRPSPLPGLSGHCVILPLKKERGHPIL